MVHEDNAEIIKTLAYKIWEQEGRPAGREHEHWAEANRRYAETHPRKIAGNVYEMPRWDRRQAEREEARAMRQALWAPEPFSRELFDRAG